MVRLEASTGNKGVDEMTFHALRGLGDCITDDQGNDYCTTTVVGGNIVDTSGLTQSQAAAYQAALNSGATNAALPVAAVNLNAPTGNASTGFNWGSLFGGLITAGANVGTSIVNANNVSKQAQANAALLQGQAAATNAASGATLASLTPFLLLGGGLLLIMSMRKGK